MEGNCGAPGRSCSVSCKIRLFLANRLFLADFRSVFFNAVIFNLICILFKHVVLIALIFNAV